MSSGFYHTFAMAIIFSFGLGGLLARRLSGDVTIGCFDLIVFAIWTAGTIYLTIDSYKFQLKWGGRYDEGQEHK